MSYFLSSFPLWLLIAVIVVAPTALAMAVQVLIRKSVGIDKLVKNNEIAGFKFATVGVIYAVLLAFTVIVVWEKFSDAQTVVADEAGATSALFHYAEGNEPEAMAARTALVNYLKAAIDDEWPAMARETESAATEHALDLLYAAAIALNRTGRGARRTWPRSFGDFDNVTAARRQGCTSHRTRPERHMDRALHGALLTVGFTLFFGSENLLAQVSMTGVLSVLVTMGLVVIISIDHPFTGPVYIHPHRWPWCSRTTNRQSELLRFTTTSPASPIRPARRRGRACRGSPRLAASDTRRRCPRRVRRAACARRRDHGR